MIKVMTVDDELLTRIALRTALEWEKNGFKLVAEAQDGIQALELAKQHHPDIVLTDISMPGMSGVELIKQLKNLFPSIEIIILSCHNDFEYVKEGMRAGAADYILKLSMSMEKLMDELVKLKEKIILKRKSDVIQEDTQGQQREMYRQCLYGMLVQDEKEMDRVISENQRLLKENKYISVAILSTDVEESGLEYVALKNIIENIVEYILQKYTGMYYLPLNESQGIIVALQTQICDDKCLIRPVLQEIFIAIYEYLSCKSSAGIGNCMYLSQIKQAYQQAYNAYQQCFFDLPGTINVFSQQKKVVSSEQFFDLMKAVYNGEFSKIKTQTENWFEQIRQNRSPEQKKIKQQVHEFLFQLHNSFSQHGGKLSFAEVEEVYKTISRQKYLADVEQTVFYFLDCLSLQQIEAGEKREIIMAKQYVRSHYTDNLRVSDVAQYVGMNVDYFSHIFKKETGLPLTVFIRKYRIQKAIALLRCRQYKVYEVAFRVGFQDENYFVRCFKQETGDTPASFMKKLDRKV